MNNRWTQTAVVACVSLLGLVAGMTLFLYMEHRADSLEEAPVFSVPETANDLGDPAHNYGVQVDKLTPPMLAIIVDDLGYGRSGTTEILDLPYPLTLSVLPDLTMTEIDYQRAVQSGHQVILHLPMEPMNDSISPGVRAVTVGMTTEEIREVVEGFLEQVPGVRAANNHMGSKATADRSVMEAVIGVLKEHDVYWIDSSTTPESTGPEVCRSLGMPVVVNNMFLDGELTREYIENGLLAAAQLARNKGYAVAIGHVSLVFAETLAAVLPTIAGSGVALVTVDQLVDFLEYRSVSDRAVLAVGSGATGMGDQYGR